MRIPDDLVEKLLLQSSPLTKEQLKDLRALEKSELRSLQDLVIWNHLLSEEELTKRYAAEIATPYVTLSARELKPRVLALIPERLARSYRAVVFDVDDHGAVQLAMEDPRDIGALTVISNFLNEQPKVHITTATMLQAILDSYPNGAAVHKQKRSETDKRSSRQSKTVDETILSQTVNTIIEYALQAGASDIHIEPQEELIIVRFRIDGLLREANKLPITLLDSLVGYLKQLASLSPDESRSPQNGSFMAQVNGANYSIQVSFMPVIDGEKVVLTLINTLAQARSLSELGLWGTARHDLMHAVVQPHGMIVFSGPNGSGRSTILRSVITSQSSPTKSIATIEDPIVYQLKGTSQTQVNLATGMTFAAALRSVIRQDPNIIMLSALHDHETARLAFQASQSGHLVLLTLPSDTAASSFPRLISMGIEPYVVAGNVRAVVASRLVRVLCKQCRKPYTPGAAAEAQFKSVFGLQKAADYGLVHELEKLAIHEKLGNDGVSKATHADLGLSSSPTAIKRLYQASNAGCTLCGHTGYSGRTGIYEVIATTPAVSAVVAANNPRRVSEEIQKAALQDGFVSLRLDGLIKALRGETSIPELIRVLALE